MGEEREEREERQQREEKKYVVVIIVVTMRFRDDIDVIGRKDIEREKAVYSVFKAC